MNREFYVVENPDTLIEKGAGKITKKYVVIFSFNGKYYHKYQTPEPSSKGGIFGFLCFNDLASVPKCVEGRKMKTLGYIQDLPCRTIWQIEVCDMGNNPCVNPNGKLLPIVVDETNGIIYYFDPRTGKFVQPGNLVFGFHPLTEFIFNNFLMKRNCGNGHKKNGVKIHSIAEKNN